MYVYMFGPFGVVFSQLFKVFFPSKIPRLPRLRVQWPQVQPGHDQVTEHREVQQKLGKSNSFPAPGSTVQSTPGGMQIFGHFGGARPPAATLPVAQLGEAVRRISSALSGGGTAADDMLAAVAESARARPNEDRTLWSGADAGTAREKPLQLLPPYRCLRSPLGVRFRRSSGTPPYHPTLRGGTG